MHRIETGPMVLQSCFGRAFECFIAARNVGTSGQAYLCVTDMNNGHPLAKETDIQGSSREQGRTVN